jgi:glycosyltransferase involved in cell wall biosynthesis
MAQDKLIQLYDRNGIFLFPSFFEGFGKVVLEAMSRGLCVVAADNGGAHDLIVSGVNGILTPTGNIESMTKACEELHNCWDAAIRISRAAAESARAYSWERVARETITFYENRLGEKARFRQARTKLGSRQTGLLSS